MARTFNEWLGRLPFRAVRDPQGRSAAVELAIRVHPSGCTVLTYHDAAAHAPAEQQLNDYAEAERAFHALWERGRAFAAEHAPAAT